MKRTVFIISGIILVLILIAIWIYVLFFGTPKNINGSFSDLSMGDTTDTNIILDTSETAEEHPLINIFGSKSLQQLTLRPIIGYREIVKNASSTPEIYYIEAGTGHIYSINTLTGEEKRVSGTTFPSSQQGVFTNNGEFVMIQSGSGAGREFTIGKFGSTSDSNLISNPIEEPIVSFAATDDNTFLYAVQTDSSVIGKSYNPKTQTKETLFTIPFREVVINWGRSANDSHFAYPKASSQLEGAVYQIKSDKISRLPIDGFGLSARSSESAVVFSRQENNDYKSYSYNQDTKTKFELPFKTIPEKCTFSKRNKDTIYCASEYTNYNSNTPEAWYRGEKSYTDSLWDINTKHGGAGLLTNTLSESGQELDIISIQTSIKESEIYFVNKNNQTLWMYKKSPNTDINE